MTDLLTQDRIDSMVRKLQIQGNAFIQGRFIQAQSQKTFSCLNPATGKALVSVSACESRDIDHAVKAARSAFDSGVWAKQSPKDRKKVLLCFADLLEKHQMQLALLETLDTGKPISDSLSIDLPGAIDCVRWYAELTDKCYGQVAPTAPHQFATITREPLGVVGVVTPWNYPLYIACAKIAPALAVGNSVILKPAEQAPLSSIFMGQLASEAGLPEGVLNVVPGLGEIAGRALGMHFGVDGISFTGSTEVGKYFLNYSAQSNMKKIFLECGGKSPNIIFADYQGLDKAAKASAAEIFSNQGQVCCAPTRLFVESTIQEEFLEKLISHARVFQAGNPLNLNTNLGAVIDLAQTEKILEYIQAGKNEGANLILGGRQILQETGGFYMEPTIFERVQNEMKIAREEIFGPVLSVLTFDSVSEVIHMANDTQYGLSASLWTSNMNQAHQVAKALRVGVVSINSIFTGDVTTPFGGYKRSGIGRDGSMYALENYTELKATWQAIE